MEKFAITLKEGVVEKLNNDQMRNLYGGIIIKSPIDFIIKRGGLDHIGKNNTSGTKEEEEEKSDDDILDVFKKRR